MSVHHTAAEGFSKGARDYQSARPDYPIEVHRWLTQDLGLKAGRRVLEVGAGTGKFTRYLQSTGAEVVALEPVASMRELLQESLPEVEAVDGTAESLPFSDDTFDAVVCAQAFHWFATPEALEAFHRVLRPGAKLGLIWNYRDLSVPWVSRLDALTRPHEGDVPRFSPELLDKCFPAPGFTDARTEILLHHHRGPAEVVVVRRTMSASFLAALEPRQQDLVREQIRALVASTPELTGSESVSFPYRTYMFSVSSASV